MNIKDIKDLLNEFNKSKLSYMSVDDENGTITLKKEAVTAALPIEQAAFNESESGELIQVKSPLVGVAFTAANPEGEPFVQLGDVVQKGQTLCLVEAMKMFNEIKAPCDGVIKSVKFENGQMAEYGTVLFEMEPGVEEK